MSPELLRDRSAWRPSPVLGTPSTADTQRPAKSTTPTTWPSVLRYQAWPGEGRQAGVSTVVTAGDGAGQGPERHPLCILSCCNLRAYSPSTGLRDGSLAHPEDTQP